MMAQVSLASDAMDETWKMCIRDRELEPLPFPVIFTRRKEPHTTISEQMAFSTQTRLTTTSRRE